MIELNDYLYFCVGNEPAGSNGAIVARVSSGGIVTSEYSLDEQGAHDIHVYNEKIYIPGTDPIEDWTLGNVYIRGNDGVWVKRRTLPLVIHTWGLCHDDQGRLWAGVGAHAGDNTTWEGRIMRSDNDGETWAVNVKINNYRVYDVLYYSGYYYATGLDYLGGGVYQYQLFYSVNGLEWTLINDVEPNMNQRLILHNDQVLTIDISENNLICVTNGLVTFYSFPHGINPHFNALVSVNEYLYICGVGGHIWRSANLIAWELFSRVTQCISIGYWPSQNCLVCSDIGQAAKLWRVAL